MKSALAKRLILTAGACAVALCLFIGINLGDELPTDRNLWFGAAIVITALLAAYAWYAFRVAPAQPPPAKDRAPEGAPGAASAADKSERSQHAS